MPPLFKLPEGIASAFSDQQWEFQRYDAAFYEAVYRPLQATSPPISGLGPLFVSAYEYILSRPTPSRLCLQQFERVRLGDCLRPAAHAKLAVDTLQMGLDRARRDEEPGSDLPVGQTCAQQSQHFLLAWADGCGNG